MSKIVWLASYPKSGNTWVRALLANLLSGGERPANINDLLEVAPVASDRHAIDHALGIESSDLTEDELSRLRPEAYRTIARRGRNTVYLKIHDALTVTGGALLAPADVTRGAIYVVRNPLDVPASFADHLGITIGDAVAMMGRDSACLEGDPMALSPQVRQVLLTWSRHVSSWLDQVHFPVHLIRYEDLHARPSESLAGMARFLGVATTDEGIEKAVAFSSFRELSRQEQKHGFAEKPGSAGAFFRKGRAGGWRETLSEAQAAAILRDHGAMMQRLGFLTPLGLPEDISSDPSGTPLH